MCHLHHDPPAAPSTIIGTLRLLEVSSTSHEHRHVVHRHPCQGEEIIVKAFWTETPLQDEWIRISRSHVPAPGLVWFDEALEDNPFHWCPASVSQLEYIRTIPARYPATTTQVNLSVVIMVGDEEDNLCISDCFGAGRTAWRASGNPVGETAC